MRERVILSLVNTLSCTCRHTVVPMPCMNFVVRKATLLCYVSFFFYGLCMSYYTNCNAEVHLNVVALLAVVSDYVRVLLRLLFRIFPLPQYSLHDIFRLYFHGLCRFFSLFFLIVSFSFYCAFFFLARVGRYLCVLVFLTTSIFVTVMTKQNKTNTTGDQTDESEEKAEKKKELPLAVKFGF